MSSWRESEPITHLPLNPNDTPAQPSHDDAPWLGVVFVTVTWAIGVVSGLAIAHLGWWR